MMVILIMSIILAIAVPAWMRQREHARARGCQENLTKIDGAKEVYAMELNLSNGSVIDLTALVGAGNGYLKRAPECPAGGEYLVEPIGTDPSCSYYGTEQFGVPRINYQ